MNIIKLSATDSTNDYLKGLLKEKDLLENTVVVTRDQTKGRGQHGNSWISQKDKSLTFSLYREFSQHKDCYSFMPQMVVSLAIIAALKELDIPQLAIKWPNDILSYNKKIGGILIENIWTKGQPTHRIIGLGLNVNDQPIDSLPHTSSLRALTKREFNLDNLLQLIAGSIIGYFDEFRVINQQEYYLQYHQLLFKKDQVATYLDSNKQYFNGIIRGVTPEGDLSLELEDESLKQFAVKQISLQY